MRPRVRNHRRARSFVHSSAMTPSLSLSLSLSRASKIGLETGTRHASPLPFRTPSRGALSTDVSLARIASETLVASFAMRVTARLGAVVTRHASRGGGRPRGRRRCARSRGREAAARAGESRDDGDDGDIQRDGLGSVRAGGGRGRARGGRRGGAGVSRDGGEGLGGRRSRATRAGRDRWRTRIRSCECPRRDA